LLSITFDNKTLQQYCTQILEAHIHEIFMLQLMSSWLLW